MVRQDISAGKRWEFGSQLHWMRFEPGGERGPRPWEPNGRLVGSGRDALRLLLHEKRWKRVWVPSYMCQEVVRSLQTCPVDLACYADSPLETGPDLGKLPLRSGDGVLIVNYFGLRRAVDVPAISVPDVQVIEDHSHAPSSLWAQRSTADFCVTSLRKILPIPDGGALWSPQGHELPDAPPVSPELGAGSTQRLGAMLLKALFLEGHPIAKPGFLKLFEQGEQCFDIGPISGMTQLSSEILSTFPNAEWRRIRRENFRRFSAAFAQPRGVKILTPADNDDVPFSVVVVFDDADVRDRVRARLIEQDIYPSALWPLDEPLLPGVPDEHRELARRLFSLPCDARYGRHDLDRVAEAFRAEGLIGDRKIGKTVSNRPLKTEVDEEEHLTVLIPCLNEEAGIQKTVASVLRIAAELPMDVTIMMIDDASTDGTRQRMTELCERDPRCQTIVNPRRLGVGRSILNAFEVIRPRSWVCGMPGDNEFRFDSIWNHMAVRQDYDLILGYYANPVIRTFGRRMVSYAFNKTVSTMYGFPYRCLNGMKLFRVECFKGLDVVSSGHAFNAELLAKAILRDPNLRIGEAPFVARGRARGTSRAIAPMSVFKAIREVYAGRKAVSEYRTEIIRRQDDD